MRFCRPILCLIVALSLVLLVGCGGLPEPILWVEKLEIVVSEDLSSTVRLIMVELQADFDSQVECGKIPEVTAVPQDYSAPCSFTPAPYNKSELGPGFIAKSEFSGKDELEYALTCIPDLAQYAVLHPLSVDKQPWGTSYELQLDLRSPGFFRQVQVTLPGRIRARTGLILNGLSVETRVVSPDTALFTISGSPPPSQTYYCQKPEKVIRTVVVEKTVVVKETKVVGTEAPVTAERIVERIVTVPPQTPIISSQPTASRIPTATPSPRPTASRTPTTTPNPQPTASRTPTATPSPQPTAATPSATETSEYVLVLTARSFQPNLPVIGLLALLPVLIVGGPLVAGVRVRRKRARRAAVGMGAAELEQFHGALLDAFRSHHSLGRMVRFELGENLEEIAGQGPLADVAYRLVEWADAEGRLGDLLLGARAQNPGNERLRRLEELTARKARHSRA